MIIYAPHIEACFDQWALALMTPWTSPSQHPVGAWPERWRRPVDPTPPPAIARSAASASQRSPASSPRPPLVRAQPAEVWCGQWEDRRATRSGLNIVGLWWLRWFNAARCGYRKWHFSWCDFLRENFNQGSVSWYSGTQWVKIYLVEDYAVMSFET